MTSLLKRPQRFVRPVFATLLCAVVIGIPLWLAIVTSFKTSTESQKPNLALPTDWNLLENLEYVITNGQLFQGLFWSTVITVPTVVLLALFGSMAAWVFARRGGIWLGVLYAIAISGVLLPPAIITLALVLRQLGLQGTPFGLIAAYTGMHLATVVFFVTGFVRTIPIELEEAATIDGAGPIRTFFSIILPLLGPVIATVTIMNVLFAWNDMFFAFFVVGGTEFATAPLNLFGVASAVLYVENWNLIFAYVLMMSIPLVVVFVVLQRKIVSGITSGAVK
ncbi:carbohydrate ABC transporter permease [Microbacterium marmarense]|uniref:Carbohydrate ABC transporter permease n=1 Tax=Microbacterium marmarense TaxID=3122051 RepID=A0ABU8LR38_9MICO